MTVSADSLRPTAVAPYTVTSAPFVPSMPPKLASSKKRKTKDVAGADAPVFLRKTYHMIETCDPRIASWSDNGESFVIREPEMFASEVIPQFFKHNKLSSFARQLNFYGFRKVRPDQIRIDPAVEEREAKQWRFHHDNFRRGRPDLLKEIRKSNQGNSDINEVDKLKKEVEDLRNQVTAMSGDIARLAALVQSTATKKEEIDAAPFLNDRVSKKRRLGPAVVPSTVLSSVVPASGTQPLHMAPAPLTATEATDEDLLIEDMTPAVEYQPGSIPAPQTSGILQPQKSVSSLVPDQEFLDGLFADDLGNIEDLLSAETDLKSGLEGETTSSSVGPAAQELDKALSTLPMEVQDLLVERIVAVVTDPNNYKDLVMAASYPSDQDHSPTMYSFTGRDKSAEESSSIDSLSQGNSTGAFCSQAVQRGHGRDRNEHHEQPSVVPMDS